MKRKALSNAGFTMVEMIMVMAIIGLLAVSVFPRFALMNSNIRAAAEVAAADIRFTQREAMAREIPLSISFNTGNSFYRFAIDAAGNGQSRDLAEVSPTTAVTQGKTLTFNSLGEPMALTVPLVISIADGKTANTVTVEPYTGTVSIQ